MPHLLSRKTPADASLSKAVSVVSSVLKPLEAVWAQIWRLWISFMTSPAVTMGWHSPEQMGAAPMRQGVEVLHGKLYFPGKVESTGNAVVDWVQGHI